MARMRIMKLTGDSRKGALEALLGRSPAGYSEYEETVRQIIEDVRARGDEAVFELEEKFDRCRLDRDSIRVSRQEIEEAYGKLDPAFVEVIRRSAANIRAYHEKQVTQSWITTSGDGTILGQKVTPIETSGCYVPGGRAVYPSRTSPVRMRSTRWAAPRRSPRWPMARRPFPVWTRSPDPAISLSPWRKKPASE